MDVRSAILQRINDRFMRFRAAFERFNDEAAEREMVGKTWNVRDLAGHLTHWTAEAAVRIPELAAGKPAVAYDFDKVNADVYRKYRRMSFVMLLPQLRAAEDRLLAALKTVPESHFIGETPVRDWIDEGVIGHYDHHWPGLMTAAQRNH
ncbi:MAG: ClbS/DfsB family four-helix bundle protein [Planctomycetes bacterium]|nr:ClbS/DfsB family four-helix bundle protein [Planctomycetota bacterium]